MRKPLFSIVVPTCDRPDTLVHCLRALLEINHDDYEIVVMDNGSDARTHAVVQEARSIAPAADRLRYARAERVSMARNWERALDHVTGQYVVYIGDDDGLPAYALSVVEAAIRDTPSRLIGGGGASFHWDDGSLANRGRGGQLVYHWGAMFAGKLTGKFHKDWEEENRQSRVFGIYDCFVHESVIADIRQRYGRYFIGCMPDVASSLHSNFLQEYAIGLNWPLFVRGYSGHSSAGFAERRSAGAIPNFMGDDPVDIDPWLQVPAVGGEVPFASYWQAQTMFDVVRATFGEPPAEMIPIILLNAIHAILSRMACQPELYDSGQAVVQALGERIGLSGFTLPPRPDAAVSPPDGRLPSGVLVAANGMRFSADLRRLGGRTILDATRFLSAAIPGDPAAHRQSQLPV